GGWVGKVGGEDSKDGWSVVTPLRWLCMPVRIEARLGVHTEFVQKQLSTRRPRSAIASLCGGCVTTDPYALMAWLGWSSGRISRMLGRRTLRVLLEAGRQPQAGVPPQRGGAAGCATSAVPEASPARASPSGCGVPGESRGSWVSARASRWATAAGRSPRGAVG